MAKKRSKKEHPSSGGKLIIKNKKAHFDFAIEETFEAGLALEGWEVKSLRAGRVNLVESYVFIKNNEAWLSGANISPLISASTHVRAEATRVRKLLLHRREIDRFTGAIDRKGYALVAIALYWKRGRVKLEIGLGKGKKLHDKRATEKARDWQRDKARIMKSGG